MPRKPRRDNDFYPTLDENAIKYLMRHWEIPKDANIFECCNGEGHLSDQLAKLNFYNVATGDITDKINYFDATKQHLWEDVRPDYTITNPPFKILMDILPLAWEHSKRGVAMLLPLSFLEPCHNRYEWVCGHPIHTVLSIPRISFTGNGRHNFVATAWYVWDKRYLPQETRQRIIMAR